MTKRATVVSILAIAFASFYLVLDGASFGSDGKSFRRWNDEEIKELAEINDTRFRSRDDRKVEELIEKLKVQYPSVRSNAAEALGKLGDPRAVEPLIGCLKDKDLSVRSRAAEALGKIGDPQAVQPLIGCLKDKAWSVRISAAEALGKLGDARAIEPLIGRLKDKNSDVRESAAEALSKLGDARAVEPLIGCLKDKDSDVRESAAEALGKLGDARAIEPLVGCLKDKDSDVRRKSAEALCNLGYSPKTDIERATYLIAKQDWDELVKLGEPAVQPLIERLKDKHEGWEVHKCAAEALGELGDARAVQPLIGFLKDSVVRRSAAEALGKLGDPKAIPALRNALPDWEDNSVIIRSLTKLGWKPTSETEQVYVWISQGDDDSLRENWAQVKRVLLEDAWSGNWRKFENAFNTFKSLGSGEVTDELIQILNTHGNVEMALKYLNCGNERLRKAAEEWAKKHGYRVEVRVMTVP